MNIIHTSVSPRRWPSRRGTTRPLRRCVLMVVQIGRIQTPAPKHHPTPIRPVHRVDLRNDLQVQLRVLDVHHDLPRILVDLLQCTPQGLRQRNQRPDDAGHPDVRQQDVLAKVSKHAVPADAERMGVLCNRYVGQLRAAQNTPQTLSRSRNI